MVQHPCQVSFKSMQGCRRSWEDKLKCVKILSVKDHNSAKICRTWIISPHALLDLWYNICTKFHSNSWKDVGGVEKTNFDVTEGRNDGMTEGRNDGMTDKANTKCPLAILWRGHKKLSNFLCIYLGEGGDCTNACICLGSQLSEPLNGCVYMKLGSDEVFMAPQMH